MKAKNVPTPSKEVQNRYIDPRAAILAVLASTAFVACVDYDNLPPRPETCATRLQELPDPEAACLNVPVENRGTEVSGSVYDPACGVEPAPEETVCRRDVHGMVTAVCDGEGNCLDKGM